MTAYDDFRFASADDLADLGGPVSRFNHNVTAIKLLKSLEAEGRARGDLTPDEQRTLARYSGWGDNEALSRLFPYSAHLGLPIHPELDGILTDDERDSLFRLRQLIADIPQVAELDPFVCSLGVPDAAEAKRGLSKAVHAGLLDEINSLRGDLNRLSESGNRLREKTIAQRLVIYRRLKAKAEMYRELLGMRQDEVRAGIVALEREALNLLAADAVTGASAIPQPAATLFPKSELAAV